MNSDRLIALIALATSIIVFVFGLYTNEQVKKFRQANPELYASTSQTKVEEAAPPSMTVATGQGKPIHFCQYDPSYMRLYYDTEAKELWYCEGRDKRGWLPLLTKGK